MPTARCVDCGSTIALRSLKRGQVFACPICDTQLKLVSLYPPQVALDPDVSNGDEGRKTRKPAKTWRF